MPLTDTTIRKAKPRTKPYKLADGGGLYLEVAPTGGRWWRWKYRRPITGKENRLSFGTYPEIGLADARARRDDARRLLANGIDPGEQRKAAKVANAERIENSFAAVAGELLMQRAKKLASGSVVRERRMFEKDLAPYIGNLPVASVTAPTLLAALRKIEARGAVETAHRARTLAGLVFRYAIATGRAERNPAADLQGALSQPQGEHFASVTEPAQVAPLLRALHGYAGTPVAAAALKLAPLVFVRPGELRRARWADIDLDAAEWRYTASKTGTPHIVPLAAQAVEILRELHPLTCRGEYVSRSASPFAIKERAHDRLHNEEPPRWPARGFGTHGSTWREPPHFSRDRRASNHASAAYSPKLARAPARPRNLLPRSRGETQRTPR